jgi:hypothetical protein
LHRGRRFQICIRRHLRVLTSSLASLLSRTHSFPGPRRRPVHRERRWVGQGF